MRNSLRRPRGFTLIELMIVLAIIAVLAAIGYPSYAEHVARSRRAEARSVLLENVQWIERQYTMSNAYNLMPDRSTALTADKLPVKSVPRDGGKSTYTISFTGTHSAAVFTLQAEPTGSMAKDGCGTLTLTNAGARNATGSLGTSKCWDR